MTANYYLWDTHPILFLAQFTDLAIMCDNNSNLNLLVLVASVKGLLIPKYFSTYRTIFENASSVLEIFIGNL